jgi:RNA polymerase sigma-70 factor, ECF subfamily
MVASAAIAELGLTSFALGGEPYVAEPLTAEATWVRGATRGDRQAFARLVDLHKRAVFGLCFRLLRDTE